MQVEALEIFTQALCTRPAALMQVEVPRGVKTVAAGRGAP
jgi:hypothetical protein